jgi:phosphohistidine swiveling domain-containing protein
MGELKLWATRVYSTLFAEGFMMFTINNGCKEIHIVPVGEDKGDFVVHAKSFESSNRVIGKDFIENHKLLLAEYEQRKQELFRSAKKLAESAGKILDQELKNLFLEWIDIDTNFQPYLMFPHYAEYELEPVLNQKFPDKFHIITALTQACELNLMQKALFTQPMEKVIEDFQYIPMYAMVGEPYNEKDFLRMKRELKKEEVDKQFQEIENNRKTFEEFLETVEGKDKVLCRILNAFIYIRTDRLDAWKKQSCMIFPFLEYIVRKVSPDLTIREAAMLSRKEILDILDRKLPEKDDLLLRGQRDTVMITYKKEGVFFTDNREAIQKVIDDYRPKLGKDSPIKGVPACKGKVKGRVKLYMKQSDIAPEDKDYILVTRHTTPADLPHMKKAIAIVTDEGSITSHSAIVSRELNIPCIIGTRNATSVLNNGDEIEVDADNGIVKIIK